MKLSDTYFSLEQINSFLPKEKIVVNHLKRSLYVNSNGDKIALVNSKKYSDRGGYWFCSPILHLKELEVKYIYFVCGFECVIIYEVDELIPFTRYTDYKILSNGVRSYHIRTKEKDGTLYFHNSNDITKNIDTSGHVFVKTSDANCQML